MGWQERIVDRIFDWLQFSFRSEKRPSEIFKDQIRINEIAKGIVESGSCDCFFLMMAHNGSKQLTFTGFKYRSIVGGYHTEWLMPKFKMEDYTNVELDLEYMQLLAHIADLKNLGVNVKDEDLGQVAISYRFENIKFVRYYFLKEDKYGMWYCMAGTTMDNERFEGVDEKHRLAIAVNKIKFIVKKYKK